MSSETPIIEEDGALTDSENTEINFNQPIRRSITLRPSILNSANMSTFKPEYLKCLPEFDGNPNDLHNYITISESIINKFYDTANPNSFENSYILFSITSKLQGNAKAVVNISGSTSWTELKDVLLRNFSDQRDEACLNRDMTMLRQMSNETAQKFYDRVIHLLNLICSYVNLHETSEEAKTLKCNLYQELALKMYLAGIREPLGTTIRCMKPTKLSEALQYVIQEENVRYFQSTSSKFSMQPPRKPFESPKPVFQNQHQVRPTFPTQNFVTPNNNFRQQNYFPSQPISIRQRTNLPPPKYFTNSQVFGKPQNSNVFKPNANRQLPKPTPMSISTRNTGKPLNYFPNANPNAKPNFVSEELYNTETTQIPDQNQGDIIENSYYDETSDCYENGYENQFSNECEQNTDQFTAEYQQNGVEENFQTSTLQHNET